MTLEAVISAEFKTKPYIHQLIEFEISAELPARALLWQMRTGKTKVIIDTACHLYSQNKINSVLIFAPNGVHENWLIRELPIHHWNLPYNRLTWRTSESGENARSDLRKSWLNKLGLYISESALSWFAFNSESMTREEVRSAIRNILNKRTVLVVFDESHDFRTPGSKRTKMARALAKKCAFRRILTGTPVTNSPLHAFSQFELLEPKALGFQRFSQFKDQYAEYMTQRGKSGRQYSKLSGYKNLEDLSGKIAKWSSVLTRKDCHDLPDLIRSERLIQLTDKQKELYKEVHKNFLLQIENEEVSIGSSNSRFIKLQQIVSGFIIDEYRDIHTVPGLNPRLDALEEEVYLTTGKVVIWCQFREDMRLVAERLTDKGYKTVNYHGGTSNSEKSRVRELFAPEAVNDIKALIGHPKSGGQGLNLSAANKIIWYSHTFDAIIREQADERATAIGGENIPVIDLVAPGIDRYILQNVLNKQSISSAVLTYETVKGLEL